MGLYFLYLILAIDLIIFRVKNNFLDARVSVNGIEWKRVSL